MPKINNLLSCSGTTTTISEVSTESSHSSQTSFARGGSISYHDEEIICENSTHEQSEIALLKAVILQAIIDRVNNSKRTEDKVAKTDASNWFNANNHDFKLVCNLVGWSPEWVIEITENALKKPETWRRNQGRYN